MQLKIILDEDTAAKAEQAAALLGLNSVNEYTLIDRDTTQLIAEHTNIILHNDSFTRFINACDMAPPPNKTLLKALKFSKKRGIK
ncbi:MAG: DUF1778 domain-containing protein [Lentisphaeraceae bacterium]|nr:DUF1778 domain-containing protein [Lentisphaeraceae bacterium]